MLELWDQCGFRQNGSYGEVLTTGKPVYFIQLAAFFKTDANVNQFAALSDLGNLYKISESNATKVKFGILL